MASRSSTTGLLPPASAVPALRQKAITAAKEQQTVIEDLLKRSGQKFDYDLQELIGKGSYGRVYRR
jgi:hypothetical protein